MAAKYKPLKDRRNRQNATFVTVREEDDEEVDDGPAVFMCTKCKLPVGDSLSWDGSEQGDKQIKLKKITKNVVVMKDSRVFEDSEGCSCLVMDLVCRGCQSVLGMVYSSTPKKLDHKRFTFCFNVADIDSYVLGSAAQMLAAEGPIEQPVTLEYRSTVEEQLKKVRELVMSMEDRLEEIEDRVLHSCHSVGQ